MKKNGRYYPKVWAIGNNFSTNGAGQEVGRVPFLGGSLPILFADNGQGSISTYAFGSITTVDINDSGEQFHNNKNWSLTKEIADFQDEKIEENELSQLALTAINFLED